MQLGRVVFLYDKGERANAFFRGTFWLRRFGKRAFLVVGRKTHDLGVQRLLMFGFVQTLTQKRHNHI